MALPKPARTPTPYRTAVTPVVSEATAGKIRSKPISPQLRTVLEAAERAAGVTAVVTSGGQGARGSGEPRTGSTRHDHGNAADLQLYLDGRKLDFTNPADEPYFRAFTQAAIANGANGIGAATNYMGKHTIHVGFDQSGQPGGPVTIWGRKGGGAPAKWLAETAKGQVAPAQVAMNVPLPRLRPAFPTGAQIDKFAAAQPPTPKPAPQTQQTAFSVIPASADSPLSALSAVNEMGVGGRTNQTPEQARAWREQNTTGPQTGPLPELPSGPANARSLVYAAANGDVEGVAREANALQNWVAGMGGQGYAPVPGETPDTRAEAVRRYFAMVGQSPIGDMVAGNIRANPALAQAVPNSISIFGQERPTGFRDQLVAPLMNKAFAAGISQYRPMAPQPGMVRPPVAPVAAPRVSYTPFVPTPVQSSPAPQRTSYTPFTPAPRTSYTPFTPASRPTASATPPRSYTPFTPAPSSSSSSSTSYTPFTPAPAKPVPIFANSSATMGIQPKPTSILGNIGSTVGNAAKTAQSYVTGLLGGGTQTAPKPSTSSASPSSSYVPSIVKPAPASAPPAPAKPKAATVLPVGGPGTFPVGSMPAAKPKPAAPTTKTIQVANPAYAEWQAMTQANPELRSGGKTTAPPQFITKTITTPAPAAKPAAPVMMSQVFATPPAASAYVAPPQQRQPVQQPRATVSSSSSSSRPTASASPYYSSSTTQGGVTVGRNTSGQTTYVSGPSGTYVVNPSNNTYTSVTTGKTFSL